MTVRYPLVLNGSQIQELQPGDTLDAISVSSEIANSATNLVGGVQGSVPYQSNVGSTAMLAPGAVGSILASGGPGAIPSWTAPSNLTAGTATNSNALQVDNASYRSATVDLPYEGTANTIPCRDASGNLNAVLFQGTATQALFADLAEKYLTDKPYEVGTVVSVGGDAEVRACMRGDRAFGAVSANPAYMMNAGLEGGTYIALKGRVPVKVIGPVKKGDTLLSADDGCCAESGAMLRGMMVRGTFPDTFAIALETNDDPGVKLVEAIIL
jgi:hypothetical protein